MNKLIHLTNRIIRKIFKETKLFTLLWKVKPLRKSLWRMLAQPGEYAFHDTAGKDFRMSDDFMIQTATFFEKFKFNKNQYSKKNVLDLGAGSRLRSLFFEDSDIYVIEPLAKKFLSLPQSDLHKAKAVHSEPAETFVSKIKEKMDFVMCLNVLDHCYDYSLVLSNIYNYLKKDGEFLLSVDIHEDFKCPMHPVSLTKEKLFTALKDIGFITKEIFETGNDFTHDKSLTIILKK